MTRVACARETRNIAMQTTRDRNVINRFHHFITCSDRGRSVNPPFLYFGVACGYPENLDDLTRLSVKTRD